MTRLILALGLAAVLTGCADKAAQTPTSPSIPDISVNRASRTFAGTLAVRDMQYYSFTVPQDSGVFVTLASVTTTDSREATAIGVGVGLGVPRGTECVLSTRLVATSDLSPQIREYTRQGVWCVSVFDPGTLTQAVRFAVRIGYYE